MTLGDQMNRISITPQRLFTPWRLVLALLLLTLPACAQLSTATLFGTVVDSTGAVIPNANITLVQTDTNFTRTITTKDNGSYRQEFLPIGPYKVTVTAAGFKIL